ncbi:MAG: ECF transporter S component [Oscillospiraceae bacterium]|jgi:riboflavin transporter FmnP|nr:ECF transporter S component [Oscillospiraceae bacterium]
MSRKPKPSFQPAPAEKVRPVFALVCTALLAAISFVLFSFEFPLFAAVPHLMMDFSDVPALLGSLLLGPTTGVIVELLKNFLEFLTKGFSKQLGFGNIMNFAVGVGYLLPYTLVFRVGRKRHPGNQPRWQRVAAASAAGLLGILLLGLGMNYIFTPLYFRFVLETEITPDMIRASVGYATLLNGIKGGVLTAVAVPMLRLCRQLRKLMVRPGRRG